MNSNIISKKRIIAIVLVIISLIGLACFGFFHDSKVKPEAIKITDMDKNEIKDTLNKQVEEGKINVQYQLHSVFKGKESKEFLVRNNPNNYYPIIFKIYDENDRQIYQSDKLMLGYELNKIYLDEQLSKGEHNCKIEIGYDCKGNVSSRFPIKITVV